MKKLIFSIYFLVNFWAHSSEDRIGGNDKIASNPEGLDLKVGTGGYNVQELTVKSSTLNQTDGVGLPDTDSSSHDEDRPLQGFFGYSHNGKVWSLLLNMYVNEEIPVPDGVSPYDYYAEHWVEDIFPQEYFAKLMNNEIASFCVDLRPDLTEIQIRKLQMYVFLCFDIKYNWILNALRFVAPYSGNDSGANLDAEYDEANIEYLILNNSILRDASLDGKKIWHKTFTTYRGVGCVIKMFPNLFPNAFVGEDLVYSRGPNIGYMISVLNREELTNLIKLLENWELTGIWSRYYCVHRSYLLITDHPEYIKEGWDFYHESIEKRMKSRCYFIDLVKDVLDMVN